MNIKKHSGFTLIESMVTLFVLTVGILGAAAMQAQALRSGGIAAQRMAVAISTQALMDRITANAGITQISYVQNPVSNQLVPTATNINNISGYNGVGGQDYGCSLGNACTRTEMIADDVFQWQNEVSSFLPGNPNYSIAVNGGLEVTATVTWSDRGVAQSYSLTSNIQPMVVVK